LSDSASAANARDEGAAPRLDPALLERFRAGDRLACARLISLVENEETLVPAIKEALFERMGHAVRVGITGPPGAGKSTLLNALAVRLRREGHTVGVIAVDPSSPFSGGAFLGDRVRMRDLLADDGVFIRSMASRSGTGGLSPAAHHAADVLDAFGMDLILMETLGVGQAELDVMYASDVVILLLVPGMGDVVQALKSGIMEIADIFVVNKADLPNAAETERSVRYLLEMREPAEGEWLPPVLRVTATTGDGVEELRSSLDRAVAHLKDSGRYERKRAERLAAEVRSLIAEELFRQFEERVRPAGGWEASMAALVAGGGSPYTFARKWARRIRVEVDHVRESG
jgi:LAO/AO transport system kinase